MHFGNFTDTKGVSQVFWDFKCLSTLEISLLLKGRFIADTVEIKPNEMPDA
jgi:hypothetical protein